MTQTRILILGGTGEGFALAETLAGRRGVEVITSMAGMTPAPKTPLGSLRRGGFGGVDGLRAFLGLERIAAVIDATHPFASQMSQNAATACARARVPVVHIWRAGWSPVAGDDWREVASIAEAADALPRRAGPTFLTAGKTQLAPFAHRDDISFVARTVAPLSTAERIGLPASLTFVHDRGPFDLASERRLLDVHDIAWIVTKNSGGPAAYPKLIAARTRGIPVVMVRRPDAPPGLCVDDAAAALAWLADAGVCDTNTTANPTETVPSGDLT